MSYEVRCRGGRSVRLPADPERALEGFRWYLSECAIQRLSRYRLLSPSGEVLARGDEVGAVPFYQQDPEVGLG